MASQAIRCPRLGCSNRELDFSRLDLGCMVHEHVVIDAPLAATWECAICHEIVGISQGVMTPCLHLYCAKCITKWLRSNATCPIDRRPLRESQLQPATFVSQSMQVSRSRCPYRFGSSEECHWEGRFESLESHLRSLHGPSTEHLLNEITALTTELQQSQSRVAKLSRDIAILRDKSTPTAILEAMELTSSAHWFDDTAFIVELTSVLCMYIREDCPPRKLIDRCFNWISNACRNTSLPPSDELLALVLTANRSPWFIRGQENAIFRMRERLTQSLFY